MTIEQKVANALSNGNLSHDPLSTTGADVMGAMAFTDRMGSLLWRVLIGNDKTAIDPTVHLLAKKISHAQDSRHRQILTSLARIALREYVDVRCNSCGGRGTKLDKFSRVTKSCYRCRGSGNRRDDHDGRIRELGCSDEAYANKWQRRFVEAHNVLQEHDRGAAENISRHLKRAD